MQATEGGRAEATQHNPKHTANQQTPTTNRGEDGLHNYCTNVQFGGESYAILTSSLANKKQWLGSTQQFPYTQRHWQGQGGQGEGNKSQAKNHNQTQTTNNTTHERQPGHPALHPTSQSKGGRPRLTS